MRKILLIILVALTAINTNQAQTFAPVGAKWHYGLRDIGSPMQAYRLIESVKDTVVMDKSCKKLRITDFYTNGNSMILGVEVLCSENNKVYHFADNEFYVLYDFNANEGDQWTIKVPEPHFDGPFRVVKVDSVATIETNSVILKALFVSVYDTLGNPNNAWFFFDNPIIERIGGAYMFPQLSLLDSEIPYLRCYEDQEINYIRDDNLHPVLPCDTIISTVETYNLTDNTVSVYPVPTNDRLFISFKLSNENVPLNYNLVNFEGICVESGIANDLNNIFTIDVKSFPAGIYLIWFYNANESYIKKIIIN